MKMNISNHIYTLEDKNYFDNKRSNSLEIFNNKLQFFYDGWNSESTSLAIDFILSNLDKDDNFWFKTDLINPIFPDIYRDIPLWRVLIHTNEIISFKEYENLQGLYYDEADEFYKILSDRGCREEDRDFAIHKIDEISKKHKYINSKTKCLNLKLVNDVKKIKDLLIKVVKDI